MIDDVIMETVQNLMYDNMMIFIHHKKCIFCVSYCSLHK